MEYVEKTIATSNIYQGNIISVSKITVELPNGKIATRDLITHPGASVVIPISDNNELYMVRQYRKPIERITLELPAGKLDSNEDPRLCAIRELKEETGLISNDIKHVISIHTTPGFTDEVLHMYVATKLMQEAPCADEDEFISSEKIPIEKLVKMVFEHEITDAKSIIGILIADKLR